jgi:hypothetical protein
MNISTEVGDSVNTCGYYNIQVENGNYRFRANVTSGDGVKSISFIRDIEVSSRECQNFTTGLDAIIQGNTICSSFVNDSKTYYGLYTDCNANWATCTMQYNEAKGKADNYEECNTNIQTCNNNLNSCSTTRDGYSSDINTLNQKIKDNESKAWWFGVIGALIGLAIYHFLINPRVGSKKPSEARQFGGEW